MIKQVEIRHKVIGQGYPPFLIAEMACAHQGDVENACDLVNVAIKANADAIQLQVFKKETYMSPIYKDYDLITNLELSQNEWSRVIELIKEKDILFFAAGFDVESIKFLIEQGVDAFKVHSSDISNPEVLKEVGRSKKPVFLGCGASKIGEIKKGIDFLKKNGTTDIILMHGYQGFPTKIEDSHLNFIKTLERAFNLNVGYYDHVDGGTILANISPIMAIGYGAQAIEKHFILTREDKGIDYESSLDQEDFISFCEILRTSGKAIGSEKIRDFTEGELKYRAYCKKSIIAVDNISKGSKITRGKVMFLRGDPGIPPNKFKNIEGKLAKREISKYHNLTYDDF
ncbi:hypothetical protein LCGC14_0899100 [marine sediment metagenome]|uniref:AFP-like domain-containing protein n=1 Tax=marine sediment metagenome TaxID=412755 RepID=A0A0F9PHN5_9ZZZZ